MACDLFNKTVSDVLVHLSECVIHQAVLLLLMFLLGKE